MNGLGVSLRRVTERVRQTTGLGAKGFQPTSNQRNAAQMKQAADFAAHLKKCLSGIEQMQTVAEALLKTVVYTMNAPFPQIVDDGSNSARSAPPPTSIGGPDFNGDLIERMSAQASTQVESQVLVPIKRWLEVFATLQANMKELENIRLEVDSRRHGVDEMQNSVDKLRAKLAKSNDSKVKASMDATAEKLQHKEGKLNAIYDAFQQKEAALFQDLTVLINDAAWLRHYVGLALQCQGESLAGAARALGDTRPDSATNSMATLTLDP